TPWVKYRGTLAAPLATSMWRKSGRELLGAPGPALALEPYDHRWLTNIYQVPGTGRVLGFIHVEHKADDGINGRSQSPGRMALAYSADYGDTWKYLGNIIVPDRDPLGTWVGGSPYVIRNGYFYLYYNEAAYQPGGGSYNGLMVARAKVDDVLQAAARG